ncbi:MAG: hypothetical protein ACR2GX_04380 [Candidatus Dormibacteria bacterium]
MRRVLRCLLAGGLALLAVGLLPSTGRAMAKNRTRPAACMVEKVNKKSPVMDSQANLFDIAGCLRVGYFPARAVNGGVIAAVDDLRGECLDIARSGPPPKGPAPGDLFFYRERTDSGDVDRVAMYVGASQAAAWDEHLHGFALVHTAMLTGDDLPTDPVHALNNGIQVMRIAPRYWPGSDDLSRPAGKIALVDAATMSDRFIWSAEHPRDADTSVVHLLTLPFAMFVATVSEIIGSIFVMALLGLRAIGDLLPRLGPLSALGSFFSRTFESSWLVRLLTFALLFVIAPELAIAVLILASGVLNIIPGVGPLLTRLDRAVWNVAGFVVTTITGIGEGRTSIFAAITGLVTLPLGWLRGLAVAARLAAFLGRIPGATRVLGLLREVGAPVVTRLRVAVEWIGERGARINSLVEVRPSSFVEEWRRLGAWRTRMSDRLHGLRVPPRPAEPAAAAVPTTPQDVLRAARPGAIDLATLPLRPRAFAGDVLGRADDAARWALRSYHEGHGWPMPGLNERVARLSEANQQRIAKAMQRVEQGPAALLHTVATHHHLNTGAAAAADLMGGQAPAPLPVPGAPIHQQLPPLPPLA